MVSRLFIFIILKLILVFLKMKANTMDRDTVLHEIISEVVQGLNRACERRIKKRLKIVIWKSEKDKYYMISLIRGI